MRLVGRNAADEQTWKVYAGSVLVFSVIGIVVTT